MRKELKGLVGIEELIPSHRFDGLSTKDVQSFTHGRDLSSQAWQCQIRKAWERERRHPEGSASLTLGFDQRVHGRASPANWFERFLAARTNYHTAQGAHQILTKYEDSMLRGQIVVDRLPDQPVVTVNRIIELLHCSRPAAAKALRVLEAAEVVHALDDRKKNRAVVFKEYLDHLREGTELPA